MPQHQRLGGREVGTEKDMRVRRSTRKLGVEIAGRVHHIDTRVVS